MRRGRCCCQIKRTFRAARRISILRGMRRRRPLLRLSGANKEQAGSVFSDFRRSCNGNDAAIAAMTPIIFFSYGNEHRFRIPSTTQADFYTNFLVQRTMSNKDFKKFAALLGRRLNRPRARCENYLSPRTHRINLTEIFPECTYSKYELLRCERMRSAAG